MEFGGSLSLPQLRFAISKIHANITAMPSLPSSCCCRRPHRPLSPSLLPSPLPPPSPHRRRRFFLCRFSLIVVAFAIIADVAFAVAITVAVAIAVAVAVAVVIVVVITANNVNTVAAATVAAVADWIQRHDLQSLLRGNRRRPLPPAASGCRGSS